MRVALTSAMTDQDVVYANRAGDMKRQAENIVRSMHAAGVKRLIFISSMGIYGEVPGERYRSVLDPYRDSATAAVPNPTTAATAVSQVVCAQAISRTASASRLRTNCPATSQASGYRIGTEV